MSHADFVHLRAHSAYSLSEGAIKTAALVELCRENRMPAVAVTDRGNLFGALEVSSACAKAGVQPIVGCQIGIRRADGISRHAGPAASPDNLVLLAQDETGYRNLLAFSSDAFLQTDGHEAAQLDFDALEGHSDGLIAFAGALDGAVGRLLAEGQADAARALLERLAGLFPGRLYVEIQRHGLEAERQIEAALLDLAYVLNLPLVATNDVYFADAGMYEAHDVLLCIAQGVYQTTRERRRLTPEHRFKSAAEMRALFADLPEAVDNTLVIARRCAFRVVERAPILPAFPGADDGVSETDALRAAAEAGLEARLERQVFRAQMDGAAREIAAAPYRERLAYELDVIVEMKFPGYFLIVADFIQWAKREGIPVGPGRGSGAGSVVAWALQITDLDPLRFGLLFERFLNPERISMPDFDVDFCQDRRDEVIAYVRDKYGADRVAQIITFGKLQARAVLRDVGRVLEMPYSQVDRLCKRVPNNPAKPVTLAEALEADPALQEMREADPTVARLLDYALKLEGLYRHASTHAAGVVIADRPLQELVPLYRDPRSDLPVTQFSMKYVEAAGLVKFDFLGLKTLTVLDQACALVRARGGAIDLATLAFDDAPTYQMLGRGTTVGIFQLESSGMRDALRSLEPDSFEDIIALVALYRPGPMDNIPSFIARKRGREQPNYLDERLTEVLKETYGVIIYQEQVMQIAQILAGYSLGSADILRRAMGKKIKAEMDAQRETFVSGAIERGVEQGHAAHIFDLVAKFAGYGFNKSHAAAYALVAYQTAYLKTHHPVEFLAASMTLDLGNTDKLNVFHQELDRLGIELRPPDINRSGAEFTVEPGEDARGAIRYALPAIRNVGVAAVRAIVAEREANGAFSDIFDLVGRLGSQVLNKRLMENMVRAGSFDSLNPNRHQLFGGVEFLVRYASVAAADRDSQQTNMFDGGAGGPVSLPALPEVEDWPAMDRLMEEYDAIGFYLSAHPLDTYGDGLESLGVVSIAQVPELVARGTVSVKLAGVLLGKQERMSQAGRYGFLQMSDSSGSFEVVVFSELYGAIMDKLDSKSALLVTASARLDGDALRLTANRVEDLETAVAAMPSGLSLRLSGRKGQDAQALERLRTLLDGEPAGRAQIRLCVPLPDGAEAELTLPGRYALSAASRAELRSLPGVTPVAAAGASQALGKPLRRAG